MRRLSPPPVDLTSQHTIRPDLFRARKCLHVKFQKEVHAAFRTKLFQRGMTMQETLEEFARLVSTDDPRLNKILDEFARRKIQEKIAGMQKPRIQNTVGEMDKDSLYDMINVGQNEDR